MSVKIRKKKLKNGNKSVYLDIHNNGERSYEFLGLYLTGEAQHDKNVMRKAEIIKGKILEKIVNGKYGLEQNANEDASFYEYFQRIVDKNNARGIRNHKAALDQIKAYHGRGDLTFRQITKKWAWGFRDFLLEECEKQNTARNYWALFKAAINKAHKRDYIVNNPLKSVENIKAEQTLRDYLTGEDLDKLAGTECSDPEIKRAFFFSCQTGLRVSDVRKVQWKELKNDRIAFSQKKTTKVNYVPLNAQAVSLMGDPGAPDEYVFDLPSRGHLWKVVKEWGEAAELGKHLHYHISRHTFATQLLIHGSDIYTVAELLGVDLKTAEVYAKIINRMKDNAVNNLPAINF